MDSGTENSDSQSPSIQSATEQPPSQKNFFEERHSDVDQKLLGEEGSEAKTNEEENCKKRKRKGRNSCNLSEAESCSDCESSGKRKSSSRDSLGKTAGASLEEMCSVTSGKIGKVSDNDQSGDSKETGSAHHRRGQRRRTGHSKRPRSRSSRVQTPPLLRKSLVTSLRTMSEAIYQNIVLLQNQQLPFSLSWEKYILLTQLREHLRTQAQTIYAMATQAAYAFPAEGWLVPAPLPGPSGPAGDEGEAQSPS
ncbi:protein FRG2-like [Phyllostomus hastatus]|uniref:protein FRG2-like n=1 Tax=Phyllostomus hastatus TaxID=9423 RepID=UPI001E67ED90|nr:protein FRG2-like [Phyllostomus hastatus]